KMRGCGRSCGRAYDDPSRTRGLPNATWKAFVRRREGRMAEPGDRNGSKRMEVVVHVGDGKTGTSAIQRMLREHTSQLVADGTLYLGLMFEFAPVKMYPWQKPGMIEAFHRLPADQAIAELGRLLS